MDKDLQRLHTYKNIYSWSLYISAKDEFTGHIATSQAVVAVAGVVMARVRGGGLIR